MSPLPSFPFISHQITTKIKINLLLSTLTQSFQPLSFCNKENKMAMLNLAVSSLTAKASPTLLPLSFPDSPVVPSRISTMSFPFAATSSRRAVFSPSTAFKTNHFQELELTQQQQEREAEEQVKTEHTETLLYSFSPLPWILVAALPGAATVRSLFGPFVELIKSWNLPGWLVHWGHPGNMAVVLFAMGGYGTYLGFRIRFSDDVEEKAKAKDLHPKLLAGMFFFFALGATGGVTSLLTSDKPIFESPHAVTGIVGLTLLTIQTILPALFEGNPGLRNVHGILGSGIMTLFLIHATLGLQLGLSF
ncbi:hypothetical protein NE237_009948 [Protea cynaroides]|uniref:Uncharacterized protein n=1 Tax=Protea cynaroides TaxID=273540 RepID=A0A9Q0R0S3_9MAGN|nr:hypothetical protein NE237_009948 [Protea cynaroides]